MDEILLTEREVADFIGKSVKTLHRWRKQGRGPVFMKVGATTMFTRRDLSEWMQEQRIRPGGKATTAA